MSLSVSAQKNTNSVPVRLQSQSVNVLRCRKCIIARGVFSQLHGVVGRKQPAFPPQPPFPPRRVGAIHHLDDVPGTETELVAFLRGEVVQRLHLNRGRPLWDSRRKTSGSEIQPHCKSFSVYL